MAKKKKKLSEIKTPELIDELAGKKKKQLLDVGEEAPAANTKIQDVRDEDELVDPETETTGIPKEHEKDEDKEGEGDIDDLRKELDTLLPIALKADSNWMLEAKEDINFCLGEQWDEQDKNDLRRQNRPVMVFNKIKPLIQLVTGHLIQTKARIQAFPEGGEDQTFTEVMDKAIDHIEKVSHLNFKMSYLFSGGEKAGKNWLEFNLDYDDDPIFGQLRIPNLGPFKVFMDPQGVEYDLSDCGFGFKVQKITKSRLKQLYPDKEEEIDRDVDNSLNTMVTNSQQVPSGDESDYGNSPIVPRGGQTTDANDEITGDNKAVTVVEYWKKKYIDRWFVYFVEDGAVEEFDSEPEALAEVARRQKNRHDKLMQEHTAKVNKIQAVKSMVKDIAPHVATPPPVDDVQIPEAPLPPKVEYAMRKRKVAKMQVSVWAGQCCLTDGMQDSPFEPYYSGYPFFRYIAEWSPEAEKPELRFMSLVRSLKDPQREKNKARSQFLHMLNTSANSGWIGDDDALSPAQKDELKEFGAVPGITIWKKKGSALDRIHPIEPSAAMLTREKAANDDFKEVSGINSDLLAMDSNENPSGKAIALRIRQAITILQPSLENFRYTKILIGKFLFSIIPTLFDSAKLEKVLGEKYMQESKLDRARLDAYLTMIHDGKYHVNINEAGAPDTLREETFEDLMQLAQHGVSMPPDLFIEFMNMPNKSQILNKVKEWTQAQAQMTLATKGKQKLGRSR